MFVWELHVYGATAGSFYRSTEVKRQQLVLLVPCYVDISEARSDLVVAEVLLQVISAKEKAEQSAVSKNRKYAKVPTTNLKKRRQKTKNWIQLQNN